MPATPVLSNGGANRGLPISCFLNECSDSLDGIVNLWNENVWLAALGGGIGSYWGNLRSIGEPVGRNGKTSGIVPFIRVQDSLTLAISQGSLRRGSAACYLPVWHPEIEEFIEMRRPTGGDANRKALNLHHGVVITDAFMRAVEADEEWALISPKDETVITRVSARSLVDPPADGARRNRRAVLAVHRQRQPRHSRTSQDGRARSQDVEPVQRNHAADWQGQRRQPATAVCCLSSLNLEKFLEWENHPTFIEDCLRFLDNILDDFIARAPDSMRRAKYSAMRERSVGLGVMGMHSFFQSQNVPIESVMAKVWNKRMFRHIKAQADEASIKLAEERGACPDAAEYGVMERFSNKIAIAPTASISIICGGASPGIEPTTANSYLHKTLSGSFAVRNEYLSKVLEKYGHNDEDTWSSITQHEGSVQHLDFLDEHEKMVFKTAFELDQRWLIELAADRAPFICQAQSLNIFLPANVHKRDLHMIHFMAWKKGVKSLYYCRSKSMQRAETATSADAKPAQSMPANANEETVKNDTTLVAEEVGKYEECLSCQ